MYLFITFLYLGFINVFKGFVFKLHKVWELGMKNKDLKKVFVKYFFKILKILGFRKRVFKVIEIFSNYANLKTTFFQNSC